MDWVKPQKSVEVKNQYTKDQLSLATMRMAEHYDSIAKKLSSRMPEGVVSSAELMRRSIPIFYSESHSTMSLNELVNEFREKANAVLVELDEQYDGTLGELYVNRKVTPQRKTEIQNEFPTIKRQLMEVSEFAANIRPFSRDILEFIV